MSTTPFNLSAANAPAAPAPNPSAPAAPPQGAPPTGSTGGQPPAAPQGAPQGQPNPPQFDLNGIQERFVASGGKFADEDVKNFEAAGFSRDHLDTYAAGLEARINSYRNQVFTAAGSEQNYWDAVKWAAANLPPEEHAAFEQTVNSGNIAQAKTAVEGIIARQRLKSGHDPRMLGGARAPTGPQPFRSAGEMKAAINDPKYRSDDAYRADVEARILASNF